MEYFRIKDFQKLLPDDSSIYISVDFTRELLAILMQANERLSGMQTTSEEQRLLERDIAGAVGFLTGKLDELE